MEEEEEAREALAERQVVVEEGTPLSILGAPVPALSRTVSRRL
jgi:hypothetical protein